MKKKKINWKTTLAGIGVILSALLPVVGIPIATATAIATALGGVGLILAKDGDNNEDEPK